MKRRLLNMMQLICCFALFQSSLFSTTITAQADWLMEWTEQTPDFPIPGVQFLSYGPLLKNPEAFKRAIQLFASHYKQDQIDAIVGLDARGFIFGTALAYEMGIPFVMARKPGKLPGEVVSVTYQKEYGSDRLEMDAKALNPNDRVLIIDDIVVTGGTVIAACQLVEKLQAQVVGIGCLVELAGFKARDKFNYPLFSLLATE